MIRARIVRMALALALFGGLAAACSDPDTGPSTITVPEDAATVQEAVDQAQPGDTIVLEPGVYHESVSVATDDLLIVGSDRDDVILDGDGLLTNGIVVTSARVVVANMTVRNYTLNGVLITGFSDETGGLASGSDGYERLDPEAFPPLEGFAVRGVTTSNNGLYGIYAFDARHGVIEQNYASGHADSGIYVGQCTECDIVVRDNVSELNAVGYEQTNASQGVIVVGNRFTSNRIGMTLLSDYQEAFVPQHDATVIGNLVGRSDAPQTPAHAEGAFGIGIGIAGGQGNTISRNRIVENPSVGIVIGSAEDIAPLDNLVTDNVAESNGTDLAYTATERAPGSGNCLSDNTFTSTAPAELQEEWPCPDGGAMQAGLPLDLADAPPGISFRDVMAPPPQPTLAMEVATAAPQAPVVDLDAITVPDADLLADRAH